MLPSSRTDLIWPVLFLTTGDSKLRIPISMSMLSLSSKTLVDGLTSPLLAYCQSMTRRPRGNTSCTEDSRSISEGTSISLLSKILRESQ